MLNVWLMFVCVLTSHAETVMFDAECVTVVCVCVLTSHAETRMSDAECVAAVCVCVDKSCRDKDV